MCTDTFLRLPEEKRNRFLQAAWEEFTTASFAEASINQIVRRARVPRGSFYQYFLDKWDLFSVLMGLLRVTLRRNSESCPSKATETCSVPFPSVMTALFSMAPLPIRSSSDVCGFCG